MAILPCTVRLASPATVGVSHNKSLVLYFCSKQKYFLSYKNKESVEKKKTIYILQVSWIRKSDYQLLTVGLSTYSSDDRFLVEHTRHMGHWALRIKNVREDDRGWYECQLSVHPTISVFVELRVVGE